MRRLTLPSLLVLGLAAGGAGYAAVGMGQVEAPRAPRPQPSTLEILTNPVPAGLPNSEQVRRGQYLVRAADCAVCHTPVGGRPFAGSFGLNTPFGIIYSTNLTSDAETGLGRMSPDTFYRALHEGIGPKGGHVYPAMPYPYFSRMTRADTDAMLAFLKTVPPVRARRPANKLMFPLNFRIFAGAWKALFFRPATYRPDPTKSAAWNRGSYLVTGPAHCAACHTPTNLLGAEESKRAFQGGTLDNWVAPDLTSDPRVGLGSWSRADIVEYLKTGRNTHANAGGPMGEVVSFSTSLMTDGDLEAIATYLQDLPAPRRRPTTPRVDAASLSRGGAIYSDACSSCHLSDGGGQARFFPPLAGNAVVQQRDARGVSHLILAGSRTGPTATRPSALAMPSYAWKLDDRQVADVATYIRNSWGNRAPAVQPRDVAGMRRRLGLEKPRLTDASGDHEQSADVQPRAR